MRTNGIFTFGIVLTSLLTVFGFQNCSKDNFNQVSFSNVVQLGELKGTEVTSQNSDQIESELNERHAQGLHEAPDDAVPCDKNENSDEDEDSDDEAKVYLCHFPKGNPEERHTICIGVPAIKAHLDHQASPDIEGTKDFLGRCEDEEEAK